MSLGLLTIVLSLVGALVTGFLSVIFWRDPEAGMIEATHRLEKLPLVMAGRYTAFTFLALAAAWNGDAGVIAGLFVAFAFMGLVDGAIYARAGHSYIKHTTAGVAASIVAAVALLAEFNNGAA